MLCGKRVEKFKRRPQNSLTYWQRHGRVTQRSALNLSASGRRKMVTAMLDCYLSALQDHRSSFDILAKEGMLQPLFWDAGRDYKKVLKQTVSGNRFKHTVMDKDGNIKDILRPALERKDEFAAGILPSKDGRNGD